MLSELIKDFISQSQNLQENIQRLEDLKSQIASSLEDENLREKIDTTPYLRTPEFIEKVSNAIDTKQVCENLPQNKLTQSLKEILIELYPPEILATAIVNNEDFNLAFKNRLSIQTKEAINSTILLKEFQKSLKEQISHITLEALKENKIDKYRLESAISLLIIRAHTKLIFIEDFYDESYKRNLLKRI